MHDLESPDEVVENSIATPRAENPIRRRAAILVRAYHTAQAERIRWDNRLREDAEADAKAREVPKEEGKGDLVFKLLADSHRDSEAKIKKELESYASELPEGRWAMAQKGVGPVFAAGLLAFVDPEIQKTAGRVWSYAGLTAEKTYRKRGEKLTHNPDFKKLCFLIGKSFIFNSGRPGCIYGQIYKDRKAYEAAKNENGDYADYAKLMLERAKFGEDTKARTVYLSGKLPPGHLDARARRYAVKFFLSHFHEVAYRIHWGEAPPVPYPIGILGHTDYVPPPGPSVEELLRKGK